MLSMPYHAVLFTSVELCVPFDLIDFMGVVAFDTRLHHAACRLSARASCLTRVCAFSKPISALGKSCASSVHVQLNGDRLWTDAIP